MLLPHKQNGLVRLRSIERTDSSDRSVNNLVQETKLDTREHFLGGGESISSSQVQKLETAKVAPKRE